jgi:hypothetical protein
LKIFQKIQVRVATFTPVLEFIHLITTEIDQYYFHPDHLVHYIFVFLFVFTESLIWVVQIILLTLQAMYRNIQSILHLEK